MSLNEDNGIGSLGWNDDPEWLEYIERYESVIKRIAGKYTTDSGLREDCAQEARLALLHVWPERIDGYERFAAGNYSESEWNANLDRYCRNVIRNSILSCLQSIRSGPWYAGRTRRTTDAETGKNTKVWSPPRYANLDDLLAGGSIQIDEHGDVMHLRHNNMDLFKEEEEEGQPDA
jgi:hypothetical protein